MYQNDLPDRLKKPKKPTLGRLISILLLLFLSLGIVLYQMFWSPEARGRELIRLFDQTRGVTSAELDDDRVAELDAYFAKGYNFFIFNKKPETIENVTPRELTLLNASDEPVGTVAVYPLPEGEVLRYHNLYFERR